MKFILSKKLNMSQIFTDEGRVVPVTVLSVLPMVVTQVKDLEKDGYKAVQFGYGEKRASLINKPETGHAKKLGSFEGFKEFRDGTDSALKEGDKVDASSFKVGDKVMISAISKGKGFQGVVKRHGFSGGSRTHGQKHSEREPGAIGGAGRSGGRVVKGMRMAGRMGGDRITIKNLKISAIDLENGIIMVKGAVPGRRGTLVEILGK